MRSCQPDSPAAAFLSAAESRLRGRHAAQPRTTQTVADAHLLFAALGLTLQPDGLDRLDLSTL
jgi:hypothetical protein